MKQHPTHSFSIRPSAPQNGFTLLELLLVMTIVGILGSVMASTLNRNGLELRRAANEAVSVLQVARFEAIKQNQEILVEIGSTFVRYGLDLNQNNTLEASELSGQMDLNKTRFGRPMTIQQGTGVFAWKGDGLPINKIGAPNRTIRIEADSQCRKVVLGFAGRIRIEAGCA
jgi:prepilin-type N-terminal cleavage/methylation domain-containing protein